VISDPSFLNLNISKKVKISQGIKDRSEKIKPIIPNEEGIDMSMPDISPDQPITLA
jgi:hypothetical protein